MRDEMDRFNSLFRSSSHHSAFFDQSLHAYFIPLQFHTVTRSVMLSEESAAATGTAEGHWQWHISERKPFVVSSSSPAAFIVCFYCQADSVLHQLIKAVIPCIEGVKMKWLPCWKLLLILLKGSTLHFFHRIAFIWITAAEYLCLTKVFTSLDLFLH